MKKRENRYFRNFQKYWHFITISALMMVAFQNFDYVEMKKFHESQQNQESSEAREFKMIATALQNQEKIVSERLTEQLEMYSNYSNNSDNETSEGTEASTNSPDDSRDQVEAARAPASDTAELDRKIALKRSYPRFKPHFQSINKVAWNLDSKNKLQYEINPSRGPEMSMSHDFSKDASMRIKHQDRDDKTSLEIQMAW